PETDPAIRLRAAAGPSRRAPEPLYGHGPAWLSTWIEHAASLDSTCPQPDGERIVTWPPSRDWRQVPTSPPSPQDRLERVQFELAIRRRFEGVRCSTPGRCFPVSFSCCRTTLYSLVSLFWPSVAFGGAAFFGAVFFVTAGFSGSAAAALLAAHRFFKAATICCPASRRELAFRF